MRREREEKKVKSREMERGEGRDEERDGERKRGEERDEERDGKRMMELRTSPRYDPIKRFQPFFNSPHCSAL